MHCIKLLLRAIFIIRDLLWQRIIIGYLMYKYDIIINNWHQSINYVIKKVYTYDNDGTNCNDTCTANVIRELCHDRDTYHYPVNIGSCSEFNDFLKALCTL